MSDKLLNTTPYLIEETKEQLCTLSTAISNLKTRLTPITRKVVDENSCASLKEQSTDSPINLELKGLIEQVVDLTTVIKQLEESVTL